MPYCPNCGNQIDENVFFQATGQCMCSNCGEIVDLVTASESPDHDAMTADEEEADF